MATPFKMKSSPPKGKLDDFFKGFLSSARQGVSNVTSDVSELAKTDVIGNVRKSVRKKFYKSNNTTQKKSNWKKDAKAGESKHQYNIRKKKTK